ncbi:hypothetical protein DB88DRAFT_491978 [Papiliotrema laurentii]|uniref:Uncharacterized protein n=1 Tax=Papiliotrema laurentii TaxID=5418 RepID=A0AAD9FNR9_PAPLA|nr:hypothetical protein DB88DRAFT_491978 [Papiliotrema laurentii]
MSLFRRNSLPVPGQDEYPSHSILLNGPRKPTSPLPQPQHIENLSVPSQGDRRGSVSSVSSYTSTPASHAGSTQSSTTPSSAKVSFAPLPEVPPELKRRNSITLGVAARKNLLIQQGTAPGRPPGAGPPHVHGNNGGIRKVYMTDDEWEAYKKQYEAKNGSDPVDLGELAKSGAKSLWRKVRSSSMSSTTSNASASSAQSSSPSSQTSELGQPPAPGASKASASPRRIFGGRRGSSSSNGRSSNVLGFSDPQLAVKELGTVLEEERSRPTSPRTGGGGLELDTGLAAVSLAEAMMNEKSRHGSSANGRRDSDEGGDSPDDTPSHTPNNDVALHKGRAPGSPPPHYRLASPPPPDPMTLQEEDGEEEDQAEGDEEEDQD